MLVQNAPFSQLPTGPWQTGWQQQQIKANVVGTESPCTVKGGSRSTCYRKPEWCATAAAVGLATHSAVVDLGTQLPHRVLTCPDYAQKQRLPLSDTTMGLLPREKSYCRRDERTHRCTGGTQRLRLCTASAERL
jgi:hypothetical protein